MDIYAKIFRKMLANQIQQYSKRIIESGIYPSGMRIF